MWRKTSSKKTWTARKRCYAILATLSPIVLTVIMISMLLRGVDKEAARQIALSLEGQPTMAHSVFIAAGSVNTQRGGMSDVIQVEKKY